jgi:hypothetical protein
MNEIAAATRRVIEGLLERVDNCPPSVAKAFESMQGNDPARHGPRLALAAITAEIRADQRLAESAIFVWIFDPSEKFAPRTLKASLAIE